MSATAKVLRLISIEYRRHKKIKYLHDLFCRLSRVAGRLFPGSPRPLPTLAFRLPSVVLCAYSVFPLSPLLSLLSPPTI